MSYQLPNSVPSRPSTPQLSRYSCQPPNRQQCSRSPPPYGHPSLSYPTPYPQLSSSPRRLSSPPPYIQSFSSPRRLSSPPPCASPLLHCQQPHPTEHINSAYTCSHAWELQYGEQRRHNTDAIPAIYQCSRILDVKLEKPSRRSLAAATLLQKVNRYPDHPDPIPYGMLLHMFQYLYGNMLDTIKHITSDLLQIRDPNAVSCKATICRFDKRDTWRVYKSRLGVQDHFYCAPHIEVALPWFPNRAAIKEVIEAIMDSCGALGKHMQPAYKFRTQKYSWKFEPGTVYESANAGHLVAKPVINEHNYDEINYDEINYDEINQEEEQQDEQQDEEPQGQLVLYTGQQDNEEIFEISLGDDRPRKLNDIKREWRFGPKTNQCKEIVKDVLSKLFGLDPRHITVWLWTKDVELNDGKWYPWGSLDNTYGLTIASQELVRYDPEEARGSPKRAGRSGRSAKEKELRDVAPTVRIVLPVERKSFAKNDENVKWLQECVEVMRTQLSAASTPHSRAAFCISWKRERREFADWFAPQVVFKPTGDGDNYVSENT
ncbi:hypothetical protein ANO14919_003210 [Xylariales sp. No.14919]|nr:hypothetical protein ANO14919_003210 [Xylariales sp. No.14919]